MRKSNHSEQNLSRSSQPSTVSSVGSPVPSRGLIIVDGNLEWCTGQVSLAAELYLLRWDLSDCSFLGRDVCLFIWLSNAVILVRW